MNVRALRLVAVLVAAWFVTTVTHELGHLIAGKCCGGKLVAVDIIPRPLPYSIFEPAPYPLVTLWGGPLAGVLLPIGVALWIRRPSMWLIAYFCMLANGLYIAGGWFSPGDQLDTTKLLHHGARPIFIGIYCVLTIGIGYIGFRRSCIEHVSCSIKRSATDREDET